MPYRNFINISDAELDKPVYRIMSIVRIMEMLQKEILVLSKPKKWDDTFENTLLSATVLTSAGETGDIAARNEVYGQCWSLHEETDAMWRIYSPDKQGAKIKTTPRSIFGAMKEHVNNNWELKCFIGKVSYLPLNELNTKLSNIYAFETDGSGIAESLLYKRPEFSHENEVRLIFSGDTQECRAEYFPFKIKPNEIIEEIIFDPRMDAELVIAYKLAIKDKGYSNHVDQSSLYRAPKGLVINI
jgi:hypothetical protein